MLKKLTGKKSRKFLLIPSIPTPNGRLHLGHIADPLKAYNEEAFLLPLAENNHWLLSFTSQDWGYSPEDQFAISEQDLKITQSLFDQYTMDFNSLYSGGRGFCDSYSPNKEFIINSVDDDITYVS